MEPKSTPNGVQEPLSELLQTCLKKEAKKPQCKPVSAWEREARKF